MSKINCNIIKDILPIYSENMVCDDTKKLVEEHLKECESCSKELDNINSSVKVFKDTSTDFLLQIKKKSKRKVLLQFSIGILILIIIGALLFKPLYYHIIYKGDRITLNLEFSVDGEPVNIEESSVKCVLDSDKQKITYSKSNIENPQYKISTKADDYGLYEFTMIADNKPIEIDLSHLNDWDIETYTVQIQAESDSNKFYYTCDYQGADANGTRYEGTMSIEDNGTYKLYLFDL